MCSAVAQQHSAVIVEAAPLQAEEHDKKLRHIVEDIPIKIKNQSGSSAGAGSGEFYIYRNVRPAYVRASRSACCVAQLACAMRGFRHAGPWAFC